MIEIGAYLKEQRQAHNLSLNAVYAKTGITDSKLSRIERGEGHSITPAELKKLADLYDVSIISFYLMAGYLSENDLKDYRYGFDGAALLTKEEHESIQTQINLLTKGRTVNSNDL